MKSTLFILFMIVSGISFGQLVSGSLIDDGRKMISTETFKVVDANEGIVFYELAVNPKGIVTSAKLIKDGTTVISTPTKMAVRNYVMTLKFEEGTHFPAFHHVVVKVTVSKE